MTHSWLAFEAPLFLLLLGLLPLIWWFSRHSLSGMSRLRRTLVTGMRMLVAVVLVACLAEPQWNMLQEKLAVMFLLDGSLSVEPAEQQAALEYINEAVQTQRRVDRGDRVGLITFGRQAAVEVPALDYSWWLDRAEAEYDPRYTNLADAMQLAAATFPPGYARRVVIVSDGNENIDSASLQAEQLLREGIGIDVVPISYRRSGDIAVEKIVAPTEVLPSTPFNLRIVLRNASPDQSVRGNLQVTQEIDGNRQLLTEQAVEVPPGKQVYSIRQQIDLAGFFTYEATFTPEVATQDTVTVNNRATAYSKVSGEARILLIENAEEPGRFENLINFLRQQKLEVTVRNSSSAITDLADLQQFDSIVLADVPRIAGDSLEEISQFSTDQIRVLVQNTQQFGCGLVVLGGPNSYGAGGWAGTQLEEALPVNFEIKNAKVQAVGALVLVIDKSGSMSGEKIKWCKSAAAASAKMLTSRDYLGVVTFDSAANWVVDMGRNQNPRRAINRIGNIGASGGTDLMPAMQNAFRAMNRTKASVKHVIVLTDGHTPPNSHLALTQQMRQQGITTSAVAIGSDADRQLLSDIAIQGNGKFYQVNDPRAIPRIFMRETRRVAMPLIYERPEGFTPQQTGSGEILRGIEGPFPPITGYVMTTRKQNPLVETLLKVPGKPAGNDTLLATWQNGLGRCAVLTTDIGQRWAKSWPQWDNYEKLLLQTVRWSLRTNRGDTQLRLETDQHDDRIEVIVNALDQDDSYVNFLTLSGTMVNPEGDLQSFNLEQTSPGRYLAQVPADQPGNYYFAVSAGRDSVPLRTAVSVPHTAEFDQLASNESLLTQMAEKQPQGGRPGKVITSSDGLQDRETLLKTDLFRTDIAPATHRQSIWPWLLVVGCFVFLGDVAFRRIVLPPDLLAKTLGMFRWQRATEPVEETRIDRLKQRKSEIQHTRPTYQHEIPVDLNDTNIEIQELPTGNLESAETPSNQQLTPDQAEELDYTSRLLQAKRNANRHRE